MEGTYVIQQLAEYSHLNILESISNLYTKCCERLEAGFLYEDIPLYCQELILVKNLVACAHTRCQTVSIEDIAKLTTTVVNKLCLGLLINICPTEDNRKDIFVLLGAVCKLVAVCSETNTEVLSKILDQVMTGIDTFMKENSSDRDDESCQSVLDIHTALEVLRHVLGHNYGSASKAPKPKLQEIFDKLTSVISLISMELIGTTGIPLVLQLLELDKDNATVNLHKLWKCILYCSQLSLDETRHYMLMCGLANWYFPTTGLCMTKSDIVKDELLWVMLQNGLVSHNTLTRKRSLYLVKRIVDICQLTEAKVMTDAVAWPMFWWSKEKATDLARVWEDFMLLAEVLEEKQV